MLHIIAIIVGMIRLPFILATFVSYLLYSYVVQLFIREEINKKKFFSKTTSSFCFFLLKVIGVKVEIDNRALYEKIKKSNENYLIISNHLSYLDILCLSSVYPSLFITSVEMENTPVLGLFCRLGGSFFVERRNPSGLSEEIEKIASWLKKGFTVTLFPEGTTSDGKKILPFKKSLFACAVSAQKKILPLTIRYQKINGKKVDEKTGDIFYWYGDMAFVPHLVRFIFSVIWAKVEISFLDILSYPEDMSESQARKNLAEKAQKMIEEKYYAPF